MRTKTIIIIGFIIIFTIFGISSYLQWEYSLLIKDVSEYHRSMSIPAISILNQIKSDYQIMHSLTMQMIQIESTDNRYQELEKKYQKFNEDLHNHIQQYDDLTFEKGSDDEFLALPIMQEMMQMYVQKFIEKSNEHDLIFEQYKNDEITKLEAISQLELSEKDFHEIMNEDMNMEIKGMDDVQNTIIGIEDRMEEIFIISSSLAIITAITIVVLTSRFVSKPIHSLIEMTERISRGQFTRTNISSKNSDVNEIVDALNHMSEELGKYKETILKQEKLSSIGELSSRLAHDIRNPLTVIKATVDLIKTQNKNLTSEDLEKLERMDDAIYRISNQVDNVLDFIKGKPMNFKKQSLHKLIKSSIEDILKPEKIKISVSGPDIIIECDFETLKVVLINLIFNSVQAIGKEGEITITTHSKDNQAIIEIEDSGPGIPEDKMDKIFEPLFTTKQEGTGLGLASCKSIIKQHNGTISVKNNPTRFIIKIPEEQKIN